MQLVQKLVYMLTTRDPIEDSHGCILKQFLDHSQGQPNLKLWLDQDVIGREPVDGLGAVVEMPCLATFVI